MLAYQPPSIISLSGRGTNLAETPGGQAVYISGSQFGPVSTYNVAAEAMSPPLSVSYGQLTDSTLRYTAASCAVTTANSIISCVTAPGVGTNLVWQVTVFNQSSARLTSQLTNYAPPTTAAFSGPGSDMALTSGYQSVVIDGACTRLLRRSPSSSPLTSSSLVQASTLALRGRLSSLRRTAPGTAPSSSLPAASLRSRTPRSSATRRSVQARASRGSSRSQVSAPSRRRPTTAPRPSRASAARLQVREDRRPPVPATVTCTPPPFLPRR